VITIPTASGFDVVGFILDQDTERSESFCEHQEMPGDIERRSGITFFPDVDATTHQAIAEGNAEGSAMAALGC
jgi:hypothetical protein